MSVYNHEYTYLDIVEDVAERLRWHGLRSSLKMKQVVVQHNRTRKKKELVPHLKFLSKTL